MTDKTVIFADEDVLLFKGIASDVIEAAENLKKVSAAMSKDEAADLMVVAEEARDRLDVAYHMFEDVLCGGFGG